MKKFKVFGMFSLLIMVMLFSCESNRGQYRKSPHERIKHSVDSVTLLPSAQEREIVKIHFQKRKTVKDFETYDEFVQYDINRLKKPVILIGKHESMGLYGIVIKDANDSIRTYGNVSSLANCIGESRQVGDTIK